MAEVKAMPFPYFGKKTNAAAQVWGLLGDVQRYIEPFCGSCAVLLNRPHDYERRYETINDYDAYLVNMLRAMKFEPRKMAEKVEATPVSKLEFKGLVSDMRAGEEELRDLIGGGFVL